MYCSEWVMGAFASASEVTVEVLCGDPRRWDEGSFRLVVFVRFHLLVQ